MKIINMKEIMKLNYFKWASYKLKIKEKKIIMNLKKIIKDIFRINWNNIEEINFEESIKEKDSFNIFIN